MAQYKLALYQLMAAIFFFLCGTCYSTIYFVQNKVNSAVQVNFLVRYYDLRYVSTEKIENLKLNIPPNCYIALEKLVKAALDIISEHFNQKGYVEPSRTGDFVLIANPDNKIKMIDSCIATPNIDFNFKEKFGLLVITNL